MWTLVTVENPVVASDTLGAWLARDKRLRVLATFSSADQLARADGELRPDVVVADINSLPVECVGHIVRMKQRQPTLRIVALCSSAGRDLMATTIRAGIEGFVTRVATRKALAQAICQVAAGGVHYDAAVAEAFAIADGEAAFFVVRPEAWELEGIDPAHAAAPPLALTCRERQILALIATAHSSQRIAAQLAISVSTVRKHRENLMRKLSLHSTAEVTAFAIRHDLFTEPQTLESRRTP